MVLNFSSDVVGSPKVVVNLRIPPHLRNSSDFYLTKEKLETNLNDYYPNDANNKFTKELGETASSIVQLISFITSILGGGSGATAILLLGLIELLKF